MKQGAEMLAASVGLNELIGNLVPLILSKN